MARRSFMWERAPWSRCFQCKENTFGFLSGNYHSISWRCSRCRYQVDEPLPDVDKKVIYIDQFVFSELFKLKAGTRREDKLTPFWQEVDRLLHRVVHLQQAVLPHSNIHHAETVVSAWPRELREAYEAMGGDMRFEDTSDVQMREIQDFASAYVEQREPSVSIDVDEVLRGKRNKWLPNIRVVVGADYTRFAPATRQRRDSTGASVNELMENWRAQGLGFDEVLSIELNGYHYSRIEALKAWRELYERAKASGDVMAVMNTNYFGTVRCMQAVAPTMRTRRSGLIINISSISGRISPFGSGAYAASKHAVEAIARLSPRNLQPSASASP